MWTWHGYAKSKTMPTKTPTDQNLPGPSAGTDAANQPAAGRPAPKRLLPPAAERALAEAASRRAERDRNPPDPPKEISGRSGPEPTRYGDWEVKGLASDF